MNSAAFSHLSSFFTMPSGQETLASPPLSFSSGKKQLIIASLAINLLSLALPLMTLQVYDRLLVSQNTGTLHVLAVGVIVLVFLEALLRLSRAYVVNWAGAVYEHTLSCNALRHMLGAERQALAREKTGTHLQHMSQIGRLREFASGQALISLIDLPFVVVFLALIGWLAGFLVFVPLVLLVVFVLLALRLGTQLKETLERRENCDRKRLDFIIEALEGIHTLKGLALEPFFQRKYEQHQAEVDKENYYMAKMNAASANYSALFAQIMVVAMIAFGATMAMEGRLTLGTLIACVLLAGRIMRPVQQSLGLWVRYQDFRLARENVVKIFALPRMERFDPDQFGEKEGVLALQNMGFYYESTQNLIFENINLELKHGQSISISGVRGSGKRTFLQIIAGLYEVTQGQILIDGIPASRYPARELVKHVGYLPMEGVIFRGTIQENLSAFGEHSKEQVHEIVKLLDLESEIQKLPNGYETKLQGSQADPIPPGIRQRIVIARALAAKPRIILFNNADRGLDKKGYNCVYRLLARLKGKATMILVSDDYNIMRLAEQHYILEDRHLTEYGADGDGALHTVSGYKELPL